MMLRRMLKFCTMFALLALSAALPGCAQPSPSPATEAQLGQMIRAEIGDAQCESDQQCRTLSFGEKDCGGPQHWLAWSISSGNAKVLEAKSAELVLLQRRRNEATGARSNCRYIPDPGAICQAKRCVLKTSNNAN